MGELTPYSSRRLAALHDADSRLHTSANAALDSLLATYPHDVDADLAAMRRDRAAELRRCAHGSPGAREASCAMLLHRVSATDPAYRLLARSGALA